MQREPILWAQHASSMRTRIARRWDQESQAMVPVIDEETGEPVIEKIPQRAHLGSSDYDKPELVKHVGWMLVLRHDGHEVFFKLTNAAAQENLNESYCHFMRAKARHFGWLNVGRCPLAAVAAGEVKREQLADRSVKGEPCPNSTSSRPCKHYIAERDARRDRNKKREAKRDAAFKPEAERMLEAQRQQTTEIVSGVGAVLADAIKGVLVAAPEAEPKKK
jgi:hypothetical protein